MAIKQNYIDEHGNYINNQNFTLAEIYTSGYIDGYTSKSTDPDAPDIIEKLTAEMVSIIKDVLPQIVEAAKDNARPEGKWNYIQTGMAVCPFCGATPHEQYKNFCAKCGARMITTEGGKT